MSWGVLRSMVHSVGGMWKWHKICVRGKEGNYCIPLGERRGDINGRPREIMSPQWKSITVKLTVKGISAKKGPKIGLSENGRNLVLEGQTVIQTVQVTIRHILRISVGSQVSFIEDWNGEKS